MRPALLQLSDSSTLVIPAQPSQGLMDALCLREHANCFACRSRENGGMGLTFIVGIDEVHCEWQGPSNLESYEGILHGGILATALDSSMVHALFAHGIVARTGHFELRYHRSARSGASLLITARIREYRHPLYVMESSISQDGHTCVTAKAKFMASAAYQETESA